MKAVLFRFASCASGATAVEYGLIAAIMSVALLLGFADFSTSLRAVLDTITAAITSAGT